MTQELFPSPYFQSQEDVPWLMRQVIYASLPVMGVAYYFFGLATLAILLSCVLGCLLVEGLFGEKKSLLDGSAVVTGILLGLTLPPGFPLWMAFLGGVVAIGLGKTIWGGLGQNVFNPSLVGRAFLQAAFPEAITTWSPPDGRYLSFRGTNLAFPFLKGESLDAVTSATPLALFKFEHKTVPLEKLLFGNTAGSLGETSALILLLCGVYLLVRKVINWRIPLSIFLSTFIFSALLYGFFPSQYPSPWFTLFSGGLLLGAFFMATDPVTSPLTPLGCWIFGFGIGFFVVLIRNFGGLPEGVMYAILLMNGVTPLINRWCPRRVYGEKRK